MLLAVIIGLLALLSLTIILSWYRFRSIRKKNDSKQLTGLPSALNTETQERDNSVRVLRAALSGIEEGVLILDTNQQVEFINDAAQRIFGSRPETINRQTFIEVVRDYEFDALLRKSISTGQQQNSLIRNRRKNQLFNVTVLPVQNGSSYIVIVTDMTERQHLEDIRRA